MKKIKSVDIQMDEKTTKKFEVRELSVGQLIQLSQNNSFFKPDTGTSKELKGDPKKPGNNMKNQQGDVKPAKLESKSDELAIIEILKTAKGSIEEIINMSCSFKIEDLKELAPSEIKEIYDAFLEVNEPFLGLLEKVGVKEAVKKIVKAGLSSFLETVAI